jgi:hypothetical protein
MGNFNGNYSDDLFNLQTNKTVVISPGASVVEIGNDADILAACRSCKFICERINEIYLRIFSLGRVPTDITADLTRPIMPINFVNWYYTNSSSILTSLNPKLSQTTVNHTCSGNFECVHDYLIQINARTCAATVAAINSFQQNLIILGKIMI